MATPEMSSPSPTKSPILERTAIPDELEEGTEAPRPPTTSGRYRSGRRHAIIAPPTVKYDETKTISVVEKTEQSKAKIREITKTNFLFFALDEEQKEMIVDAMFEMKKKANDIIIRQFDKGDYFYVIDSGEVDVLIAQDKTSEPVKVSHLNAGESFGELALMHNCPRAATIQATTDCVLWAIDQATYRHVMMKTVMEKRMKYQDFISKVRFFDSLDKYERQTLCDALQPQECEQGIVVVAEGDIGTRFYIIESGRVEVLRTVDPSVGPTKVGELGSGEFFGEVALLSEEMTRKASVIALSKCKFLTLEKSAFQRLLGPIEDILKRNIDQYEEWMRRKKEEMGKDDEKTSGKNEEKKKEG
ncbi:putative cAMP-dependent protein kinase regulatory subunit [Monocercomonoides exilis]|uniref:putative cAMP-dependent protein kinase regulatory subunit n=1 Tax=Monocercomonoides exilis TaxID=2049356 RepID=UPI00355A7390|nr:putative cAMP-dependent protein kinase regulatory subunit [Monocercomonoides exilis]|eukprot:MONOS_10654.1-p1 / transcript=MONOS_10654.1 / gene=MONOS_10654 / organism=Monocercomonoides_exilis_PA203 / gene_product=cAMP-dependent protein kinase regulatory subunit / transcript_product=cAMP-dependent protein kinase regulatory subunit / location=Mono_scaffold00492:38961-40118(+) / protein_length=358 / sequence_SO=supercontig / SO=protein_coding / is_pseudo=false